MSELTFAVRFAHVAGPDRPGILGQAPGGFSAAFLAGSFFFFLFLHVRARPRFGTRSRLPPVLLFPLSTLLPLLLFVRCRSRSRPPPPSPSYELLPLLLVARRSAGF